MGINWWYVWAVPIDGGCDGIYVFVNSDLISEDDDVVEKAKKDVKLILFTNLD